MGRVVDTRPHHKYLLKPPNALSPHLWNSALVRSPGATEARSSLSLLTSGAYWSAESPTVLPGAAHAERPRDLDADHRRGWPVPPCDVRGGAGGCPRCHSWGECHH